MAEDRVHTAGPSVPDRDIPLDLLGPAASGSGSSRSKGSDAESSRTYPGWSGLIVLKLVIGWLRILRFGARNKRADSVTRIFILYTIAF